MAGVMCIYGLLDSEMLTLAGMLTSAQVTDPVCVGDLCANQVSTAVSMRSLVGQYMGNGQC